MPALTSILDKPDLRLRTAKQSMLAQHVMTVQAASASLTQSPTLLHHEDADTHNEGPQLARPPQIQNHYSLLPPPALQSSVMGPPHIPNPSLVVAMRALHDSTTSSPLHKPFAELPPYCQSYPSTAPGSPRILERQNSGQTPRIRPHATTLSIPGVTRSRASPDGRIPDRDVAAKLVVIMVGLPARGKSYITKKIQRYLSWQQHNTETFNVGNRRRVAASKAPAGRKEMGEHVSTPTEILVNGSKVMELGEPTKLDLNATEAPKEPEHEDSKPMDQSAAFFDPKNEDATKLREQLAMNTLDELLEYLLHGGGSVGILDATNSTIKRRRNLINRIKAREPKLPILFIESVCEDKDLLEANMRLKLSGPDYKDKDPVKSLEDFRKRVKGYESAYEPLGEHEEQQDLQYIKMIDVGRKVVHYSLKGFLSASIAGYMTTFNLSPRQIWITRHGQSEDNILGKIGGDSPLTERGRVFSHALYEFITYQRKAWLVDQQNKLASAKFPPAPGDHTPPYPEFNKDLDEKNFCVWTSMLRRCVDTATFFEADDDYDVKYWEVLNELNAGQFEGKTFDQIAREYPDEFRKRSEDKLNYVFPGVGGESYLNLINRLRDMVREMERITDHILIIGHRSICRVLMAYFMNLTRHDIADIDVHLGMAYCIEPKPYGIAFHAYRYNESTGWFDELPPDFTPHKFVKA